MKKILSKVLIAALPIALAACAAKKSGTGMAGSVKFDKNGKELSEKIVVKKLNSVQDYLKYVDLERVYMSTDENGSPAMFLAVPSLETAYSGGTKEAAIGYYFKGSPTEVAFQYSERYSGGDEEPSSYRIFEPFRDDNVAVTGTTGYFGFPCLQDSNAEILPPYVKERVPGKLKMDYAVINAKALGSIDAILAIPEASRTEDQQAKILELTDADLMVLFDTTTPDSSPKNQEKIMKARIAVSKLHQLMNGFRLTAIPRGGVQTNCQSVTDENGNAIGLMPLDYTVPAPGYEAMDREFYVQFNNAVEKEVTIDGIKQTIIVNADNQELEVKADSVHLVTDSGMEEDVLAVGDISDMSFTWMKRPESTFHNADLLINLYKEAGYTYRKATTTELTQGGEAFPPSVKQCGLITRDENKILTLVHEDNEDYYKSVRVALVKNDGTYPLYFISSLPDAEIDNAAKAKCGCVTGLARNYYNYTDTISIDFNFLFHTEDGKFTKLDDKECSKFSLGE